MHLQVPSWRRAIDLVVVALFLVAVYAPLADELVRSDEERGPAPELRAPAPAPALAFDAAKLSAFPAAYEAHFKDTFGWRDRLLRGHSIVKVFLFGVSPTPSVILGRDGSMIYVEWRQIDDFRGVAALGPAQLEAWRDVLQGNRDRLRERGIEYLFAIAPNKETIYPERVPARFNRVGPSRFDQMLDFLREHSDAEILDLRPALLAAKREDAPDDEVYLKDGTHWNARGALAAYREMIGALSGHFPELEPVDASGLERVATSGSADSWAPRMYIGDLRPQTCYVWRIEPRPRARLLALSGPYRPGRKRVTEIAGSGLPRAIFVHDSFGPSIETLLAEHFSRLRCDWSPSFDAVELDEEKPDVVIHLVVERALLQVAPGVLAMRGGDGNR